MTVAVRKAGVLGAGTMGSGIARVLADGGISVQLCDRDKATAHRGRSAVAASLAGRRPAPEVDAVVNRITVVPGVAEAVSSVDLVVECVPEVMELKRDVWREIAGAVPEDAVCTSNTSSFDVENFAALMDDPARTLGVHWYNPAYLVPCVEVVPGVATDRSTVERVVALLRTLGKTPITVANRAGFVGNRIQFAMIAEAFRCWEDGIASAEDIDAVIKGTFGFRLAEFGVFEVADMGGLDVYLAIFEYLRRELGDRFQPPPGLHRLVSEGHLGMKAGSGVYEWPAERTRAALAERDRRLEARLPGVTEEAPDR